MLVACQLNFKVRCRSPALLQLYGAALTLLRQLEHQGMNIKIEHIYREFNGLADGLASEIHTETVDGFTENWLDK